LNSRTHFQFKDFDWFLTDFSVFFYSFFYVFQAEFSTPVPVQGLFGVVNVAKAFQEKLRMKNSNKDSEDLKEGDLEKRKIKSVLGGSRGIS
jgi:hypothetical protein